MNKLVKTLLICSFLVNVAFITYYKWEHNTIPDEEQTQILSEMTVKTINSPDFDKIKAEEEILQITPIIQKNEGKYTYNMEVAVTTKKTTYFFTCSNDQCTKMESSGESASIYEGTKIPFKK